jgi:hypothetical protein
MQNHEEKRSNYLVGARVCSSQQQTKGTRPPVLLMPSGNNYPPPMTAETVPTSFRQVPEEIQPRRARLSHQPVVKTQVFFSVVDPLTLYPLVFLLVFSVSWTILYSFNPRFVKVVRKTDIYPLAEARPCPVKCVMNAAIFSLVVIAAIIAIKILFPMMMIGSS